jgi:hypothetical protein
MSSGWQSQNCIDFSSKLNLQKWHHRFKEYINLKKWPCQGKCISNPLQQILRNDNALLEIELEGILKFPFQIL